MSRRNCLQVFFLLGTLVLLGQSNTKLNDNITHYNVVNSDFLPDATGDLEFENIIDPSSQSRFKSIDSTTALDPAINTYWLRFDLESQTELDEKWVLDFPFWAYVNLFVENESGQIEEQKAGFMIPLKDRDYVKANNNYIMVDIPKSGKKQFFVRLESILDKQYIPTDLSFMVHHKSTLDQENETRVKMISIFMGAFLVMFFYNLFVYFSTRDTNYLYYLSILLMIMFLTMNNSGYIVEAFSFIDNFPAWRDTLDNICVAILTVSVLQFTRRLLNFKENFPKWNRIFLWMIRATFAILVLQFVAYEIGFILSSLLSLLMFIFIIILAVRAYRKGVPSSGYFLLGWIFALTGSFILIFAASRVIPFSDFNVFYALPLGFTFEMIFFSFALGNRINILKKENEVKQEKIIAQLLENEELQTKVQRELEQKVEERTHEINDQKQEIADQKDAIEQEKEKADNLLLNILPESTAMELKQNGVAIPRYYEKVSVLFNDIVGFTQIAEQLTPEELVKELDYCFRAFDDIIAKYHLEKIKTIGDSYMCAGGVPIANDSNPYDAVQAGLEMQSFMAKWNKEQIAKGLEPWKLKVGIHTGPLISGVVGKNKFAYDIWGDTVNLASRMVSPEGVGKVNISETTYHMIKDKYQCVHRGKVNAKNKGEVEMYYVEGLLS